MTVEDQIVLVAVKNAYLASTKRIEETSNEYQLRRIFREYSKKFFTPLYLVTELPLEDVLTDYWESYYEDMDPKDLLQEISRMVRDPKELKRAREIEDADDADMYRMMMDEKRQHAAVKKLDDVVKRFASALLSPGKKSAEVELVQPTHSPPKIEQRITMRFAAPDEIDDDADSIGLLKVPVPHSK